METVSYPLAFVGGLIAFITPCVLPLVPVYLCILSGASFDEITGQKEMSDKEKAEIHSRVISNALAFIVGFSIVFIALGFVSQAVAVMLAKWAGVLIRVIGVLLVVLGLNMVGIWKPAFLSTEARFQMQKGKFGLLSSMIIGSVFAFGWSPCVGPILAPILAMAAGSENKLQAGLLLATFSLGLGIPFFLAALFVNGLIAFTNKMKKHFHKMELIVGTILILVGLFLAILGMQGLDNVRRQMGWLEQKATSIEQGVLGESEDAPPITIDEENGVVYMEEPEESRSENTAPE